MKKFDGGSSSPERPALPDPLGEPRPIQPQGIGLRIGPASLLFWSLDRGLKWMAGKIPPGILQLWIPGSRGGVTLVLSPNPGFAFGFGAKWPLWVRRALTLGVIGLGVLVYRRLGSHDGHKTGSSGRSQASIVKPALLVAGALGNGFDRLILGSVQDCVCGFGSLQSIPCFNLADIYLAVWLAWILIEPWNEEF